MKTYNTIIAALFTLNICSLQAQNLVVNSDFTGGSTTGWSTTSSIEINPQNVYGGPSSSIYVTEIDAERSLSQQVCVLRGLSYTFTYQAARRPQTGSPANPGIQVKVTGLTSGTNYVNSTQAYNNSSWSAQSKTFTVTIPSSSTDKKVNIEFLPNNNSTTYGVIVWDIELAPASTNLISINGPATSGVSTPNNFSLVNSPAGASYNWSFSGDASSTSSSSATPTGISWASMGSKNVTASISNSTCTMATYSKAVTISSTLPIEWTSFTGAIDNNFALLTWVSAQESEGKYFVISRSTDGTSFDSIGVITSRNSSTAYTYQYIDKTMPAGDVAYRIEHVDLDGVVSFSKIITLTNAASSMDKANLRLFPNPAISTMNYTITSMQATRVDIGIYSASGVLMMTSQAHLTAGFNQNTINIGGLNHGNYFLKIVNAAGNVQSVQSFIKL